MWTCERLRRRWLKWKRKKDELLSKVQIAVHPLAYVVIVVLVTLF